MRGILSDNFFLVGRERKGQKGYLVFTGLMTGINDPLMYEGEDKEDIF